LLWEGPAQAGLRYNVYRAAASSEFALLNKSPLPSLSYSDLDVQPGVTYGYQVRAIDRRDQASLPSPTAETSPLPETQEPVFAAPFGENADAVLLDGKTAKGKLHGDARVVEGALTLGVSGFASFDHQPEFDLTHALSVECWVRIDQDSAMPVVLSCGAFHGQGWFVQRYGSAWRWHVAPFSCDGGRGAVGRWTHLVGTYSGTTATLYQDGQQVASIDCYPNRAPWPGPLVIGQYSSAGDSYQVHGRIAGVKIYRRVLRTPEVATHFRNGPPVQSVGTLAPSGGAHGQNPPAK
jgi:hypothetical protein